jgi:hypothetical protein
VTIIFPAEPERPTTEGTPAGYIEDEWTLLQDGKAYFLPPLPDSVDRLGPEEAVWASNGVLAAHAYAGRWRGVLPEISRVSESFSNGLDLVGYQASHFASGQPLTITLYWRPEAGIGQDVQLFVQLLDRNGEARTGFHDWPMHGAYRVRAWQPGEIVPLSYQLSIPADLALGGYRLICGAVDLVRQVRIPLASGEELAELTMLKIPPPTSQAVPAHSIDATFGSEIELAGYTLSPQTSALRVRLFWQARAAPRSDYTVFVHLVDADGRLVAQSDAQPVNGTYPTSIWSVGEAVEDEHHIAVPSGRYRVYAGLYRWDTMERLPVVSAGEPVADDRLLLGSVTVP